MVSKQSFLLSIIATLIIGCTTPIQPPLKIKNINDSTIQEQITRIQENPYLYTEIKNPTYEIQLAAIKKDPSMIQYVMNPSKELQLIAVNSLGRVIEYINHPDRDVQLSAVKNDGIAIQYISNPDKEIQMEAVKQNGFAIKYIHNPDKDLQLAAVKQTSNAIYHIKNPVLGLKYVKYLQSKITIRPENFMVTDNNLEIFIKNNEIKILNRTNEFITITSLAEYYGLDISHNEITFTLPPQAVIERNYKVPKSLAINTIDETITYGFAVQYSFQNTNKQHSFFKTLKKPASDFLP